MIPQTKVDPFEGRMKEYKIDKVYQETNSLLNQDPAFDFNMPIANDDKNKDVN